jgi:hypothetical protein
VPCHGPAQSDPGQTAEVLYLLDSYDLGRKRMADALLAATLLTNSVREIITCNGDDFRVFEGPKVTDPRTRQAGTRHRPEPGPGPV